MMAVNVASVMTSAKAFLYSFALCHRENGNMTVKTTCATQVFVIEDYCERTMMSTNTLWRQKFNIKCNLNRSVSKFNLCTSTIIMWFIQEPKHTLVFMYTVSSFWHTTSFIYHNKITVYYYLCSVAICKSKLYCDGHWSSTSVWTATETEGYLR